jgi:hypothetical protein
MRLYCHKKKPSHTLHHTHKKKDTRAQPPLLPFRLLPVVMDVLLDGVDDDGHNDKQ